MLNQETAASTPVEKPATETPATTLVLTDAAAAKFRDLTKGETNPAIGLRVYIISGGCSGYRYGMMVEETANPDDQVFETNGVKVYLDEKSVPLVIGSSVDYVDSLMGAGFTVENPNSVGGCGCGSSFRTAESAGAPSACSH
jgi:iron-sulfur cluster assembly protein